MVGEKRQVANISGTWKVKVRRTAPLVATSQCRPVGPKTTRGRRPDVERPEDRGPHLRGTEDKPRRPIAGRSPPGPDGLATLRISTAGGVSPIGGDSGTGNNCTNASLDLFFSDGTLENPNKFFEDFEAFYLRTRTS
ncbi:hypothetical protein Zmor_006053 [Zophobas morio]|uniref:Uncharacterized protein n=1 Tax=Zophobas morio TaxID=2755281 RepID=A0AA38IU70_9CUCU|nr:hypothetical protein Zmor_006053 [Zophobas morio]